MIKQFGVILRPQMPGAWKNFFIDIDKNLVLEDEDEEETRFSLNFGVHTLLSVSSHFSKKGSVAMYIEVDNLDEVRVAARKHGLKVEEKGECGSVRMFAVYSDDVSILVLGSPKGSVVRV